MTNGDGVAIIGASSGEAPVNATRLEGASRGARPAMASFHVPPRLSQVPAATQPEGGISPGAPADPLAARPTYGDGTERVHSRSPQRV
jgi:hypothetical protein